MPIDIQQLDARVDVRPEPAPPPEVRERAVPPRPEGEARRLLADALRALVRRHSA